MGTLVFVCPATGQEVTTGIEMDKATLASLRGEPLRCPYCPEAHQISDNPSLDSSSGIRIRTN